MKHLLFAVLFTVFMQPQALIVFGPDLAKAGPPALLDTSCPGAPKSRLVVGQYGVVSPTPKGQQPAPDKVHVSADASSNVKFTLSDGAYFQIISGPVCAGGFLWWKIQTYGGDGWVAEGSTAAYFIDPVIVTGTPPAPAQFSCDGALPTRFAVNAPGVVLSVNGGHSLNVRADAGTAANSLGALPAGRQFTIIDGPRCVSGVIWWKAQTTALSGWIAEGDAQNYFIQPTGLPVPSATPSPSPVPSATPSPLPPSATPRFSQTLDTSQTKFAFVAPGAQMKLIWSPTGDQFLVAPTTPGSRAQAVYTADGQKLYSLADSSCETSFSGWTPDGQHLICRSDNKLTLYDAHGQNITTTFPANNQPFTPPAGLKCPCTFSPEDFFSDGRLLFDGQFSANGFLNDRLGIAKADGSLDQWLPDLVVEGNSMAISSAYVLSGDRILASDSTGVVAVLNTSGTVTNSFHTPPGQVGLHDNAGLVLMIGVDFTLGFYGADGTHLWTLEFGPNDPGFNVSVSPDGRFIGVSHQDRVDLLNAHGVLQGTIAFSQPLSSAPEMSWSPTGNRLAIIENGLVWFTAVPN